jgi:hypothetical protein
MKIKSALLALAATAAVQLLAADPAPAETVVFLQADPASPIIARLKAGSATTAVGDAPVGWKRVEVDGTFEAFARSGDITKNLEVREGANLYTTPAKDARILTVIQKDDKSEVTGMVPNSDFCQVRLQKKLQGFVALGETANRPAMTARKNEPVVHPGTGVSPANPSSHAAGRPVAPTSTADLPRLFTGTLVLARRAIINPNPPYEYQLTDSSGRRFAYVDTKRLVLPGRIDALLDQQVNVTGIVRNTVDGKDLVVAAESMVKR